MIDDLWQIINILLRQYDAVFEGAEFCSFLGLIGFILASFAWLGKSSKVLGVEIRLSLRRD